MGTVAASTKGSRQHRFLARTLSTSRWPEFERLLRTALELGWLVTSFEQWVRAGGTQGRVLILRHDVDQHPATAVKMARLEARYGLSGTWYFRWRTSAPRAISEIRTLGGGVGLHYETLTRLALARGINARGIDESLLAEARDELRREVAEFKQRFGPIHSIAAHGDTRVPGVSNQLLLSGVEPLHFGVAFDAGETLARHRLGVWLTDRIAAEGGWKDGMDPLSLLRESSNPILCLTHPNNWCSGASLWWDRAWSGALPGHPAGSRAIGRRMRTGDDAPTAHHSARRAPRSNSDFAPSARSAPRPFPPVAVALRREILRHHYDRGEGVTSDAALRTLETNSSLAETRAATLEHALERAGVFSVRGLELADLGAGFGGLSLVFAARGARVTALEPNEPRMQIGAAVARDFGLRVDWIAGGMHDTDLGSDRFDIAVMNNSFCYVVDWSMRRATLELVRRALRPGGVLVIRNPKRYRLVDQFSGTPLIGTLPPNVAHGLSQRVLMRERSHVRMLSGAAVRRELRRAGFVDIQLAPAVGRGRLGDFLSAYQHHVARKPTP
jgi:2-polyprenyl-3-methyl-5-hydroxy-6-metoxy-1,4-benzoquinol methylase